MTPFIIFYLITGLLLCAYTERMGDERHDIGVHLLVLLSWGPILIVGILTGKGPNHG